MVTPGTEHDFTEAVQKFGFRKAKAFWMASIRAIRGMERFLRQEGLGSHIRRTGHLNVALNPADVPRLREERRMMRRAGLASRLLEGGALEERVRSPLLLAGLRVPYTCALSPPVTLVQGLAEAAHRAGAAVQERVRVQRMASKGGQVELSTSRGRLLADAVVIATEGYTPHGWLPYHIYTRKDNALATPPLPRDWFDRHWPGDEMFWNWGVHYHAFRKSPDGRILFFSSEGARRGFREFFPGLHPRATHAWNCRIAGYHDQLPRIGPHPELKDVYFAGGYRGHGLPFGFLAGRLLADLIGGRKNRDACLFAPYGNSVDFTASGRTTRWWMASERMSAQPRSGRMPARSSRMPR
jgi:glycine/D-amino acid oxidase-like deaminating enzyme